MNKLLKYLADRDLESQVKNAVSENKKRDGVWVLEKSELFMEHFKEELRIISDAWISYKFNRLDVGALLITFHFNHNGSTFLTAYVSDDNWSPDWKTHGFSDYPNHYLLDVVGDWYKSLLPAPVKKEPVILFISFPEDTYKGQAAQSFKVECPFSKDELSTLQMQMFKYRILDAYGLMGSNLTADFDFDNESKISEFFK